MSRFHWSLDRERVERDRPTWRHARTALIGLQARSLPTGGLTATSSSKTTCYLLESKGRYLPRWDSPTPTPTKTIDFIPLRFFFSFFFIYFLVRFLVTCSYYLSRKLDDQVLLFVCASLVCACDLGLCGCGFISKRREEPFLLVVTTGGVSCCPGALCVRIQRKDGSQEVAAALLCREEGFQEERQIHRPTVARLQRPTKPKTASASRSSVSVTANKTHLDPCSSGTGTVCMQNHEPECSSMVSSWARTEPGTENIDHMSFSQFDVVQDFSDHHYAKTSAGKVTKDWVKAIQSEWNLLQKNLPESIYVRVYEDRIDLLRAAIVGPAGTPYHDGLFFFDVRFPSEYPKCPPKVYYHSGGLRLNPNLYESGKVCLSLLNTWWGNGCEKWGKSNSTMLQVLVSIQGLVLNDKPYFNEPGNKNSAQTTAGERYSLAYNQTAFVRSCKTMLYSLRKPPKHFETLVMCHFHEHERAILDACSAYMSGTIVGSSVGSNLKYARDKCFADFHKSLTLYTEHLRTEFAANRRRVLELEREASAVQVQEIVPSS